MLIVRNHFWPFTEVQNGNQREVMTKCGNFFRPEETKGRKDSIWFHTSESSLRSLRLVSLPAVAGESLGSCFYYKDCSGKPSKMQAIRLSPQLLLSAIDSAGTATISAKNWAGSRLFFLAEFLESGIGTQRIPDWIEFKKGLMQLAYERRCSLGITRFCR
jgi:hypothetical protein